ncbi:hypothetical protein [Candidatus Hodgkinia cicadicola]|uniref:hypothetical protein n=1 Tax=Candidatus Hodgkinia cicadicola TaxID=573658 RepID=UPI001788C291
MVGLEDVRVGWRFWVYVDKMGLKAWRLLNSTVLFREDRMDVLMKGYMFCLGFIRWDRLEMLELISLGLDEGIVWRFECFNRDGLEQRRYGCCWVRTLKFGGWNNIPMGVHRSCRCWLGNGGKRSNVWRDGIGGGLTGYRSQIRIADWRRKGQCWGSDVGYGGGRWQRCGR